MSRIAVNKLVQILVFISDKCGQLGRRCRLHNESLFDMLIQEKVEQVKNPRFEQDFKTFADVLIQEVAKHFLECQVSGHIGTE